MNPIKSQVLGLSLAIFTAVGTLAYERLVKAYSIGIVLICYLSFYIPLLISCFIFKWTTLEEINLSFRKHPTEILIFWISSLCTPIWYAITRSQGAMVGSIYEVKYVVMMAILYIFYGENKFTWNIAAGVCCALLSVWFISRK